MSGEAEMRAWLTGVATELADAPLELRASASDRETWMLGDRHLARRASSDGARRSAALERWILERLGGRTALPTPEPVAHDATAGFDLLVRTPGEPLDWRAWQALGPGKQAGIARDAGRFLAELHAALPVGEARARGAGEPVFPPPYDRIAERLLDEDALEPVHGLVHALEPVLFELCADRSREAVLHNDLSHHNLAFDASGRVVGVFDFGDACVGDPHRDLRYAFSFGAFGRRMLDRYADIAGFAVSEPRVRAYHAWSALAFLALDLRSKRLPMRLRWVREVVGWNRSWIDQLRRELR